MSSYPKIVLKYDTSNKEDMVNSNSVVVNQPIQVEHSELTVLVYILVAMVGIMLLIKIFSAVKISLRNAVEATAAATA